MKMRTTISPDLGVEFRRRFSVDLELANHSDLVSAELGIIAPDKVRRLMIRGVVDSRADSLVVPVRVAMQLGLPISRKVNRCYAGQRSKLRNEVKGVHVTLLGRDGVFRAVVEPKQPTVLIGAIVLGYLDLLVDCKKLCLVPRDPKYRIVEI